MCIKMQFCWYFSCKILFLSLKMQVIPSYHDLISWHLAITSPIISIRLDCLFLSQTVGGSTCFKLPIFLSLSQYSVLKYLRTQVSIIRMNVLFSFSCTKQIGTIYFDLFPRKLGWLEGKVHFIERKYCWMSFQCIA